MAIFGGTAPFIIAALIQATGNDLMPAFYLMAQDHNPLLEMDTLPFGSSYGEAPAAHGDRPNRPTLM